MWWGTWPAGQGQPLLSMRNSQMADGSWGNSCKCNLRGCLICGIAQACIHCILGLLWRNILNKTRWLCSVSQFKRGSLQFEGDFHWLYSPLGADPLPLRCLCPADNCGCFDAVVLVTVLFGAKMCCRSESLVTHTSCGSLVCLLLLLAVWLQL